MRKLLTCGFALSVFLSQAQQETSIEEADIYNLSLEKLMELEVSVTTKKGISRKESPGIITIITEKEIKKSGARDLLDVLRLVPGLSFASDVEGVVGLASRGNWGHEGKILLLMDGQELNEIMYSTTQFGNHYDVSQIKRIEIIRGPGSSIYGGYAELGVINVITKSSKDYNGFGAQLTYGIMEDTYARRNVSFGGGKQFEDFSVSLSGMVGEGQRSSAMYTDVYGNTNTMKGKSDLNPTFINLGASYKSLNFRFIYDNYRTNSVAVYDEVTPSRPKTSNFESVYSGLNYDWKVNDKLTITPQANLVLQTPWASTDTSMAGAFYVYADEFYDINAIKTRGNIRASYDFNDDINLLVGTEYFNEYAKSFDKSQNDYFINGSNEIDFQTISFYGQLLMKNPIANLTLGARLIDHSKFGDAFAPRVGITKKFGDKLHAKLLVSGAYRAPGIENINLNENVRPEKTRVAELELGYSLSSNMLITANVFDIAIDDPIVYFFDFDTEDESYLNFDQSGSRGFEIEYKLQDDWGFLNVNHSYYNTGGKNQVDLYRVEGVNSSVLGLANHKTNLMASFNIFDGFSVNPSTSFIGKRYGVRTVDQNDESVITSIDPVSLLNINFRYENVGINGLTASFAVFDMFNEQFEYVQPFDGLLAPIPATGREFVFRISYDFDASPLKR